MVVEPGSTPVVGAVTVPVVAGMSRFGMPFSALLFTLPGLFMLLSTLPGAVV
jgi:hypothetical protein